MVCWGHCFGLQEVSTTRAWDHHLPFHQGCFLGWGLGVFNLQTSVQQQQGHLLVNLQDSTTSMLLFLRMWAWLCFTSNPFSGKLFSSWPCWHGSSTIDTVSGGQEEWNRMLQNGSVNSRWPPEIPVAQNGRHASKLFDLYPQLSSRHYMISLVYVFLTCLSDAAIIHSIWNL